MNDQFTPLNLVRPRCIPFLDPDFIPAHSVFRSWQGGCDGTLRIALERGPNDISVHRFPYLLRPGADAQRMNVDLILWQIASLFWLFGGHTAYLDCPPALVEALKGEFNNKNRTLEMQC